MSTSFSLTVELYREKVFSDGSETICSGSATLNIECIGQAGRRTSQWSHPMKINSGELEIGMTISFVRVVEFGLSLSRRECSAGSISASLFVTHLVTLILNTNGSASMAE